MADKISFKKIQIDFVKKNYPVLFNTLQTIEGLTKEQQEKVAGLCIEVLLKCDGTPALFEDELLDLEVEDDEF